MKTLGRVSSFHGTVITFVNKVSDTAPLNSVRISRQNHSEMFWSHVFSAPYNTVLQHAQLYALLTRNKGVGSDLCSEPVSLAFTRCDVGGQFPRDLGSLCDETDIW